MQVFYKGFNLYEQFPNEQRIIKTFINYELEELINFETCHSFSVAHCNNSVLHYYGGKFDENDRSKIINKNNKLTIIQVCCVDDKIILLEESGGIFKINPSDLDTLIEVPKFYDSNDRIIKISAGAKILIAYSQKGCLYNVPEKVAFKNSNITDIKTGREHCLLLEKCGYVYSFGRGSRGQLGHSTLDDHQTPNLINALAGLRVVSIAAGGWHSCAVTADGDLYVWGWNCHKQLGLRVEMGAQLPAVMGTPQVVDVEDNEDVVVKRVACGGMHTLVMTDNNKLYGCGWNKYKQLLDDEREEIDTMTYLQDFSRKKVVELKCGPWSSYLICSGGNS